MNNLFAINDQEKGVFWINAAQIVCLKPYEGRGDGKRGLGIWVGTRDALQAPCFVVDCSVDEIAEKAGMNCNSLL